MSQTNDSSELHFQDILQRNRGRLAGIARSYAGAEAEDLLQEILMQVWRALKCFRGDAHIDTWCYRIALNTAISWRRKQGRRQQMSAVHEQAGEFPGRVDGANEMELLRRFLATLSEIDRAIVLMYLDDLSSQQMAEVLGVNAGAVRTRIHRIKQKLVNWEALDS